MAGTSVGVGDWRIDRRGTAGKFSVFTGTREMFDAEVKRLGRWKVFDLTPDNSGTNEILAEVGLDAESVKMLGRAVSSPGPKPDSNGIQVESICQAAAACGSRAERYRWKPGTRLKSDPQACGERIKEMRECLGRALSRDDIAADAKSKSSPFHEDVYEFDDVKAAHTYRLEVASLILRGIDIVEVRVADKKACRSQYTVHSARSWARVR